MHVADGPELHDGDRETCALCTPIGVLIWNEGRHRVLWTPTPGQDITKLIYPWAPRVAEWIEKEVAER